jgi:hypothetical protein
LEPWFGFVGGPGTFGSPRATHQTEPASATRPEGPAPRHKTHQRRPYDDRGPRRRGRLHASSAYQGTATDFLFGGGPGGGPRIGRPPDPRPGTRQVACGPPGSTLRASHNRTSKRGRPELTACTGSPSPRVGCTLGVVSRIGCCAARVGAMFAGDLDLDLRRSHRDGPATDFNNRLS